MKGLLAAAAAFAVFAAFADTVEIGGVKYECRDGMCVPAGGFAPFAAPLESVAPPDAPVPAAEPPPEPSRILHGNVGAEEFIAFLEGREAPGPFAGRSFWLSVLIALFGGFCLNLTPCVLPLAPVTLMVIGRSAARGALFALGLALAYGALGLAAVAFGSAFGAVQGSPWFSAAAAVLFAALGLASCGAFRIDFSRRRNAVAASAGGRFAPGAFAFLMGAACAVLAGACVAPVVVAALAQSASLAASGDVAAALALPLALGVGMAAPWPFAAAGMRALPKPGRWMPAVNRILAAAVFALAARYAYLAWRGFAAGPDAAAGAADVEFASPEEFSLAGLEMPVVVDCWASWCGNCRAMEKGTLADPRVREALSRFTFVKLRAEDIGSLKRLPGFSAVAGLPAFLVFDSPAPGRSN